MAANNVHDELSKKVNSEMSEYEQKMLSLPASQVYAHADEISAMKFCCNQLLENLHAYPSEYTEYLLRFEQPLTVVRDHWLSDQSDSHSEAFEFTLWDICDKRDAEVDYAMDSGPNMG